MRAAQSKGIADLLALWPALTVPYTRADELEMTMFVGNIPMRPWLVQCKYSIKGGGRLPAHEEIELVALAELTGAIPVLARTGKNGRGVEFLNLNSQELIA